MVEILWSLKYEGFVFDLSLPGLLGGCWISRLESGGYSVGDYPKGMMARKSWPAPKGGSSRVVIFSAPVENFDQVCAVALGRGLKRPHPEVACALREVLNEGDIEAMGFEDIVVAHQPIEDRYGDLEMLVIESDGSLTARPVRGLELGCCRGIAFEA